jgi:hypothetical protein
LLTQFVVLVAICGKLHHSRHRPATSNDILSPPRPQHPSSELTCPRRIPALATPDTGAE